MAMDKQIFAAIEVSDHEIRLIIGEFFNTRFNIIKVERVPVYGLTYDHITNPEAITKGILKAVQNASKQIGASIERVLLCIPSFNMHRYPLKVTVPVDGIDGVVTVEDIRKAVKKAMATNIAKDQALIQTVCVKYTVNGITSRRIPLNEKCNELTVDIDLLTADRQLAFDLVGCVEKTGLEIMDICLDMFGIAKEAALFEQAVDQQVIVLKLERQSTTLALLAKGKLKACDTLPNGIGTFISKICDTYGLQQDTVAKLIKYNARLNLDKYSTNPIYIWAVEGETKTINEDQLCKEINGDVKSWVDEIATSCQPILQAGPTTVIITGEGGEMQGLSTLLAERLNVEVKNYTPETLGVRYSGLTSCLGLFYAYKDQLPITGYGVNSVDMKQFAKTVSYKEKESDDPDESITKKLKGMLFEAKK